VGREDAASYVVEDFATEQSDLIDVIDGAKHAIHRLENVRRVAVLVGALVMLGAPLAQGAPALGAALGKVRKAS
jgi:hypothetical protein